MEEGSGSFLKWLFKEYGLLKLLAISLVVLALIWGVAHWTAGLGERVSVLWGLVEYTKGTPSQSAPPPPLTDNDCPQRRDQCEAELSASFPISDIEQATGQTLSRDEIPVHLRRLADRDRTLNGYESNFAFKLFLLEHAIRDLGGSINTKIQREDRRPVYKLIQEALQEIGYYAGPIDGNSVLTYQALAQYQTEYNERFDDASRFAIGFMGYGTLESIRSAHRMRERHS